MDRDNGPQGGREKERRAMLIALVSADSNLCERSPIYISR